MNFTIDELKHFYTLLSSEITSLDYLLKIKEDELYYLFLKDAQDLLNKVSKIICDLEN